ncbi:uncharacterized protein L201_002161 [Kwoniella dendrophila CBS 6074]|uniref:Protein CPL1-like domain-containing protein n=1 Tax=Kwoniella dendrophila CBS 6074 TaxID=1295534 RepID=A0AAX4JQX0_9TREE
MILTFLLFLISLSPLVAEAGSTFVGCVLSATVALTGSNGAYVSSQASCNTRCLSKRYQYSYYTVGTLLTTNNCYCDNVNSFVAASAYLAGSSASTCMKGIQAAATDLSTSFSFNGCASAIDGITINLQQGTLLGGSLVSDPQSCFEQCKGGLKAYFVPIVPSLTAIAPSYGCVCDPSGQITSGSGGISQFYGFIHSASASAASQAKKRQARDRRSPRTFCPKGLKACRIPGDVDSWECIDPETELESCGGCRYGEYGNVGNINVGKNVAGIDCSVHPGVSLGGSTCSHGTCQILACKRKWRLEKGRCVREQNLSPRSFQEST